MKVRTGYTDAPSSRGDFPCRPYPAPASAPTNRTFLSSRCTCTEPLLSAAGRCFPRPGAAGTERVINQRRCLILATAEFAHHPLAEAALLYRGTSF